jgi:hypothetical protein
MVACVISSCHTTVDKSSDETVRATRAPGCRGEETMIHARHRGHRMPRMLLVLLVGILVVGAVALVARKDPASGHPPELAWGASTIERALERRLAAVPLSVRWVQCVTPRGGASRYRGARVLRCAANFGDPHMPVYCSTIVDGALVTDRDVLALRC